ncbi:hypothetical protein PEBR_04046 [Penicillium brasilianum]|uniref:DUF7168 domain-containing protein n=1 Tax=Penicillium brasilianum TaxID=104259 RepID=A0A1S9RY54_PENBI|nr:hypothetical protein PEBR_04046 [Penicillium brasilianum]
MSEHNVTQADLMANDTGSNAQYGGRSIVRIEKVAGSSRRVMKEAFVNTLAKAICTFFDCKCFSTDRNTSVDWTFFGIADNTIAASAAFEMAHDLILEWACAYKGGGPTFSYRLGVADGLRSMANLEKGKELEDARHHELGLIANEPSGQSKEDHPYTKREEAASSIGEPETPDSANDDINSMEFGELQNDSDTAQNEFDFKADFDMDDAQNLELCDDVDEAINKYMKREPTEPLSPHGIPQSLAAPGIKVESDPWFSTSMASRWRSEMQLVQFRATSEQVADDYLREQSIKLRKRRKARALNIRDRDSYSRGRKDSSKINVRQRTLM